MRSLLKMRGEDTIEIGKIKTPVILKIEYSMLGIIFLFC